MENKATDRKKVNIIAGLAAVVLITSLPLFTDFLLTGTNLQYQLLRIEALKDGWKEYGLLLWSRPDWTVPQGASFAFFYGDTFLYLPAFFRLLGINVQMSYRLFLILINAVTAVFSYVFMKDLFDDEYTGLIGSVLYTVSVYRIFLLYSEAEVGEVLALAFLPLVLLGICRIFGEERKEYGLLWLAAGLSGVLRSHILSFGIVVLFLILFMLLRIKDWKRASLWKEIGLSALLFLTVNLNYLYAMFEYLKKMEFVVNPTSGIPIQEKGLQVVQLFMCFYQAGGSHEFGRMGVERAVPAGLGLVMLIAVFVFCYLVFTDGKELEKREKRSGWICLFTGLFACLLSTVCFPYNAIMAWSGLTSSLISMMQAPWHFLQAALAAFSVLGCITYRMVERKYPAYKTAYGICLAGLSCFSAFYLAANLTFTSDYIRIREGEALWFPVAEEGKEAWPVLASGLQVGEVSGIWYLFTIVGVLAVAGCIVLVFGKKRRQE